MAKTEVLDRTFTIPANGKETPIHSTAESLQYSSVKLGFRDSKTGSSDIIEEYTDIDSVTDLYTIESSNEAEIQCSVNDKGIILVSSIYDNSMPSFALDYPIYDIDYWRVIEEIEDISLGLGGWNAIGLYDAEYWEKFNSVLNYRTVLSEITILMNDDDTKKISFEINQDKPYILNLNLEAISLNNLLENIYRSSSYHWPPKNNISEVDMVYNYEMFSTTGSGKETYKISDIFNSTDDSIGNQVPVYINNKYNIVSTLYAAGVSNTIDSGGILDSGSMIVPGIDDTIGTGDGYETTLPLSPTYEAMEYWTPVISFVDIHDIYLDRPAEKDILFKLLLPKNSVNKYEILFQIKKDTTTAVPLSLDEYKEIYNEYDDVISICELFEKYLLEYKEDHTSATATTFSNLRCPCIYLMDNEDLYYNNTIQDITIDSDYVTHITCSPEFANKIYYKAPYLII